ncbi:MAG: hypothetical protein IT531_25200 [Burkholderiales bacterium]|nr:hypothetical protein [Burkholderiales bacterium]
MNRIRTLTLLGVLALYGGMSRAQSDANSSFSGEISKQASIYQSRGENVPGGYFVDRSLMAYSMSLPAEFGRSLAELAAHDRWLDIGAGEGNAVLDYVSAKYDVVFFKDRRRPEHRARAVAISIEDRRTARWNRIAAGLDAEQVCYLHGKRLGQYAAGELGTFRMITDVLGGFSYTDSLTRFMEKALALLEVQGVFYTLLQDVRGENGTNRPYYPDASYLTEITDANGAEVRICAWLKRIGCVEVTCELKPDYTPPIEVYRVRKVCSAVTVPKLAPKHYQAGTPPERKFELLSNTSRPGGEALR